MKEVRLGSRTLQPHRQLLADGHHVHVGRRALDILSVLAEAGGEIVTKDELLAAVWPDVTIEENALQVHIVALRKALGPEAERLKTIRGIGYQLELVRRAGTRNELSEPSSARAEATLVVMPFASLGDDAEQVYFAQGISEDIVTDLSKVSALAIIAGKAELSCNLQEQDATAIAQHFQASHVLEGSVRKSGDRIRITAQLADGVSGAQIWAERYDRRMADVFDVQDELSRQIVGALKLRLLPSEKKAIEARGTRSPEAYDAFLMARALRSAGLDSIRRSLEAYRQALAIDAEFAEAWAGYATALIQNRAHFHDSGIDQKEIDSALKKASRLAPDLPDVIASRAQNALVSRDWSEVDRCIAEFRSRKLADWSIFSALLVTRGYPEEAIEHQLRICRAEPFSGGASLILQIVLDSAGRHKEAESEYSKAKAMSPSPPMDLEAFKRAAILTDQQTARERLSTCLNGPTFLSHARELAAALDDRHEALAFLESEIRTGAAKDPLAMVMAAHIALFFGADDLALRAIRIANVEVPLSHFTLIDIWHPHYSTLHNAREFKSILEDTGLIDHCRRTGKWGRFLNPIGRSDFEVLAPPGAWRDS